MADWSMYGPQGGMAGSYMGGMAEMQKLQAGQIQLQQAKQQQADQQALRADAQALPQNLTLLQQMQKLGSDAIARGDLTSAMSLNGQADKLIQAQGLAAERTARAQVWQATQAKQMLGVIGQLMEGVHDQASWDQANRMFTAMTGHPSPLMGTPFSADTLNTLKSAIQLDHAHLEQLNVMDTIRNRDARTASYQEHTAVADQLARARIDKLNDPVRAKTGGTVGVATTQDVGNAIQLLQREVPGWEAKTDPNKPTKALPAGPQVRAKGLELANDARRRMKQQPGLTFDEALNQSYADAKSNGDFKTQEEISKAPWYAPWEKDTKTESTNVRLAADRPGGVNDPLPLPKSTAELKEGAYYKTPNGDVYKNEGGKPVKVRSGHAQ